MMGMSFSHLIVILLVVFIIFGAGKLPQVMGDLGKGLKAFKDAVKKDHEEDEKDKK